MGTKSSFPLPGIVVITIIPKVMGHHAAIGHLRLIQIILAKHGTLIIILQIHGLESVITTVTTAEPFDR